MSVPPSTVEIEIDDVLATRARRSNVDCRAR